MIPDRDPAGPFQQNTQFGVGMCGADMLNDDVTAAVPTATAPEAVRTLRTNTHRTLPA